VLTASEPGAERAADGNLATAWQAPSGSFLRVDLGRVQVVSGVVLRLGPRILDYPRLYTVLGSDDGATWREIGGEVPAPPPLASYRRDHRDVEMVLAVRPGRARLLEIRVAAYSPGAYARNRWAVHELQVLVAPKA
jgi:hypothetical protein